MTDAALTTGDVLHILEIVSIIGGGGGVAYKIGRFAEKVEQATMQQSIVLDRQTAEIEDLKVEMKKLNDVLTTLAVQDERLNALNHRLEELAHGQGFIGVDVARR
jgi:hypothetical protein